MHMIVVTENPHQREYVYIPSSDKDALSLFL